MWRSITGWGARRWSVASGTALGTIAVIAIPTAMIDTPLFGREIPTTRWAWPALLVTAALSGLLVATYVRRPGQPPERASRRVNAVGPTGGLLTFFAVGCPVCNKLALLALGSAGALQWFAPVQPYLALAAVALLAGALVARLRGEVACPVAPGRRADGSAD